MNLTKIPLFNLKDTDYVLDVGGGHVPFPRANVIVEKFPEKKYDFFPSERGAPVVIPEGAKLIKADATDMPFKDKEFDFVVCAETINHVKNPIGVCKEIIRVGKRGYMEVPGPLFEIFASHPQHLHICLWDGKTLRFVRNHWPQNSLVEGKALNKHIEMDAWWRIWRKVMPICREATYIEFVWDNSFNYELIE